MKIFKLATVVLLVAFSIASPAKERESKKVVISVSDALIPSDFNGSSNVYAIVSGLFPNGCYSWNEALVSHHKTKNIHAIKSIADVYQGMCIMALIPFTKQVQLGVLGRGKHIIRFLNGDGTYMEKRITLE